MNIFMTENFKMIKNKVKESVNGKVVKFMRENGLMIKCKGGVKWFG
jgi:hypothetical protein